MQKHASSRILLAGGDWVRQGGVVVKDAIGYVREVPGP